MHLSVDKVKNGPDMSLDISYVGIIRGLSEEEHEYARLEELQQAHFHLSRYDVISITTVTEYRHAFSDFGTDG